MTFDKLLLHTAFCCMASDGNIDNREITLIRTMCSDSTLFGELDFQQEMNALVTAINIRGKEFISDYFDSLATSSLTEKEELLLIDFAIQTIKADDQIEYSEIKFFKNIRHRLKVSNEIILSAFPEIEQFLEEDIITETLLDKITRQYLDISKLPQFDRINIVSSLID